ncbi:tyrosine-type recombinase/integrase [Streptomyces sp. NPDC053048]|uniref:tyrosine-type recombinase/integrase n=1 Tax=Streptomyces sp. NPDC053048 TaxID=3365694 RepID=UPI0037D6B277
MTTVPGLDELHHWLARGYGRPLRDGTARALQGTTPEHYGEDIADWLRWIHTAGVNPWQADHTHATAWLDHRGGAARSRNRYFNALHTFYIWAVQTGLCRNNPFDERLRPSVRDEPGLPVVDATHMTALMQAADGLYAPVTPRNRALIYAMLAGLRPGAIVRLDTDDLRPRGTDTTAKVWQKGGGTRLMVLPPLLVLAIDAYLPHRLGPTPGPLLTTRTGGRLDAHVTPRTVLRTVAGQHPLLADFAPTLLPDAIANSARNHGTSPTGTATTL